MVAANTIPLLSEEYVRRQQRRDNSSCTELWDLLDVVTDPEIPVLSLWELGVLQNVERAGTAVTVTITPTYSGCPAMSVMADEIRAVLSASGVERIEVVSQLAPAWTTDWMSTEARRQLREYGIAPPQAANDGPIHCPQCGADDTRLISEFGSTACKALYQCSDCGEPFDYFKCI